jgi:hypothetical protein
VKVVDKERLRGTLRVWISVAIVIFILIMAGFGQWDLALAGLIGLVVANGLKSLLGL